MEGASKMEITIGKPISPIGFKKTRKIPEGLYYFEIQYPGERIQIHNKEGNITIFKDKKDITRLLPEIVALFFGYIENFILEARLFDIDKNNKPSHPRAVIKKRTKMKDIIGDAIENPLTIKIFDILLYQKMKLVNKDFSIRTKIIEKEFHSDFVSTSLYSEKEDEIRDFVDNVYDAGFKGILIRKPGGKYDDGDKVLLL